MREREFVQSLERGLQVMLAFDGDHPRMTLSQVAQRTGMTRAAARRFLLTLEATGYVGSDGRDFFLQSKVLELGSAYLIARDLPAIAQRHLQELARESGESCSASIIDGQHVVYIARFESVHNSGPSMPAGTRVAALDSAMGIIHLAALPPKELEELLDGLLAEVGMLADRANVVENIWRARHQGWFAMNGTGSQSIAVPVHNSEGLVIAAIEAGTITDEAEANKPLVQQLVKTAEEIGRDLRQAI